MNRENLGQKRIRGLRRHFRNLRLRAKQPSELRRVDVTWLVRHQQTYLNVIADPWASCKEVPRKQVFRALWVERFLRTFPYWQAQVAAQYPAYYLAIWLYEPTATAFCQSRLMVAVDERRSFYESVFDDARTIPLPSEYLMVPGIEEFDWQAYAQWSSPYTIEEFAQASSEVRAKPHEVRETEQGEPYIIVQRGMVWVGQARNQL